MLKFEIPMKKIVAMIILTVPLALGQYSLSVELLGGAQRAGETNLFRAVVMRNGNAVKTIERVIPYDVPFPASFIHEETGITVLSYSFDGFVEVYDNKGNKQWVYNFFKEMEPNYERTITVALGATSIAFNTSDVTLPNAVVLKFSVTGEKLWETSLPYAMGYEIAMSNNEHTVVAGSYIFKDGSVNQAASLIDEKGALKKNFDILFRKASFSKDNQFIALSTTKEVMVIATDLTNEIRRINKKTEGMITDLLWFDTSLVVQEAVSKTTPENTFIYTNPVFVFYSADLTRSTLKNIPSIEYKTSALYIDGNALHCDFDGNKILISQ